MLMKALVLLVDVEVEIQGGMEALQLVYSQASLQSQGKISLM